MRIVGEEDWEPEPTKYYIRSSVLRGQVVSEAWANGRKHRSYVKGIGNQTAVQSAYAAESASLNEVVLFEFSDASGMSYRTTNKLGEGAATGDGGEGSPAELDPMGGSIGTSTPFITLIVPYEPEYPGLQPFNVNIPSPNFASLYATFGSRIADLPGFGTNWGSFSDLYMMVYEERLANSRAGFGFITNEQYIARANAQASATAAFAHEGGHSAIGRASNGRIVGDDYGSGADETGGNGQWVDQSTADVDLENNIVTVYGGGYWDFGAAETWQSQVAVTPGSRNYVSQDDANKLMVAAYNGALDLMKNKNCRDAVSTTAVDGVEQAERISKEGRFTPHENEINGTAIADSRRVNINASAMTAQIHIDGGRVRFFNPFFQTDINSRFGVAQHTPRDLGLSADQARVLIVLHEIAHVTGKYVHPEYPSDHRRNEQEMESNTMNALIWHACFGTNK